MGNFIPQDDHDQHRAVNIFLIGLVNVHMDKFLNYSLKLELNELNVDIDHLLSKINHKDKLDVQENIFHTNLN